MSLSVNFDHRFPNLQLKIAFEAPTPGVTAFFGPSGCGKSTVVMAVIGLLRGHGALRPRQDPKFRHRRRRLGVRSLNGVIRT